LRAAPVPSANELPGYSLADLASCTGARLEGDATVRIDRVATLDHAAAGAIAFLANPRYRAQLATTRASAVIVAPAFAADTPLPKLVSDNPYATYANVARLLHPAADVRAGIHASAIVDPAARVAASAHVGPHASVAAGATIGERSSIGGGCSIGADASIGDDVRIHANVVVYDGCSIGARSIVHAGAVIGADGFGMAEDSGRWIKIPQVGRVVIGADVEIGANTTIDRGAIEDTLIGDDVKIDNQVQVGHNCRIGAHTAIAGCVGIAGSTRIGRNCRIGGAAMIGGHLDIADDVVVSGATVVFDSIAEPGVYTGVFPTLPQRVWRQVAARIRRLDAIERRISALEALRTVKGNDGE
jgi:UDP-3-O-[3-hydroxymyristoyl] glucosamine N-acyltransferase